MRKAISQTHYQLLAAVEPEVSSSSTKISLYFSKIVSIAYLDLFVREAWSREGTR